MVEAFLPIETARCVIRAMRPSDAEALAAYRSDPAVARYQSWSAPYPLTSAQRLIDEQPTTPTAGDWVQLAMDVDGELAGDVAVGLDAAGHVANIGYTLATDRQGTGLATVAVGAVVDRLFDQLGVHRVEASLDARNVPSARLVERLGFDYEGTSVSAVLVDGEWTDDARYALTAEAHDAWRGRAVLPPNEVRLVEVTHENVHAVRQLRTHHSERRFVSPMEGSFADALAPEPEAGAPVVPWLRAIEADGEIVGFIMIAERTAHHPDAYLWRLLIDRRHQRRGIGRRAVEALIDRLRGEGQSTLYVSWVPGPGSPEPLYLKLGFVRTGEMEGDEVVGRLDIEGASAPTDHRAVNLANWESRVPLHVAGYGIERLVEDPEALSYVVQFDRLRLGDISGLDAVHLQCHIGTDTVSLARLGARVTGLDFSPSALAAARDLAARCGVDVDFIESDVEGAVGALGGARFDLVYTGIGAINWLPSIERWADVVVALLRPGGRLFMREGHPMLQTLSDPRPDGLLVVEHPYFETPNGTFFRETKSYVEHEGQVRSPDTIEFNHGIGPLVTALLDRGMTLTQLVEHDSVPWNPLGSAMTVGADEEWRLVDRPERLPLTFTLQVVKGT